MKDKVQEIKDSIIACEHLKAPRCWICKDDGLVYYKKTIYEISYEFAYRCSCKRGQVSSDYIPLVPDEFARKVALENYKAFSKLYPPYI